MVVRSYGGKIKREYHVINAMLVDLPKNAVEKIKKLKDVVAVEPNVIVHAYEFANYMDTIPWNIQDIKANLVWNYTMGVGVNVWIRFRQQRLRSAR